LPDSSSFYDNLKRIKKKLIAYFLKQSRRLRRRFSKEKSNRFFENPLDFVSFYT